MSRAQELRVAIARALRWAEHTTLLAVVLRPTPTQPAVHGDARARIRDALLATERLAARVEQRRRELTLESASSRVTFVRLRRLRLTARRPTLESAS
jgi:hypothetical protein